MTMKMKIKNQLMMAVALLMAVGCAEDETPKTAEDNAVEGLPVTISTTITPLGGDTRTSTPGPLGTVFDDGDKINILEWAEDAQGTLLYRAQAVAEVDASSRWNYLAGSTEAEQLTWFGTRTTSHRFIALYPAVDGGIADPANIPVTIDPTAELSAQDYLVATTDKTFADSPEGQVNFQFKHLLGKLIVETTIVANIQSISLKVKGVYGGKIDLTRTVNNNPAAIVEPTGAKETKTWQTITNSGVIDIDVASVMIPQDKVEVILTLKNTSGIEKSYTYVTSIEANRNKWLVITPGNVND